MSAEGRRWLAYAEENRRAAGLCLDGNLFNPCLQNAQQAVEKSLKALYLASGLPLRKTHSIGELRRDLLRAQMDPGLSEDAAELLDTIYPIFRQSILSGLFCRILNQMPRWPGAVWPSPTRCSP